MQAPTLTRQCADPQTFFETHNSPPSSFLPNTAPHATDNVAIHQYFSNLARAYSFFVQGTPTGIQTHAEYITSRLVHSLSVPLKHMNDERLALLARAQSLHAQSRHAVVRTGASVADHVSTIYNYIARRVACELRQEGKLALTLCPNNEAAILAVRRDMSHPQTTAHMLNQFEHVENAVLLNVRQQDVHALRQHLQVWDMCAQLHQDVVVFDHKLRANVQTLKL